LSVSAKGGAAIESNQSSRATLKNCIVWGNDGDELTGSGYSVSYSDIEGGWPGTGNIDEDPLFADAELRLSVGSPCLDGGNNTAVPADTADIDGDGDTSERTPLDLDGNPRFVNDPPKPDNGVADPPDYPYIVDMGAYELDYVYGDIDGSGTVDGVDLGMLVDQWVTRCRLGEWCDGLDLDRDGKVAMTDFAILASDWMQSCP